MDKTKVTQDLASNALAIERTFDAPLAKLWRAYTDKEWFEKWWGPQGWQTKTKEFDFKPGGRIHYCMKCVDKSQAEFYGQESWGLTVIEKIDEFRFYRARDLFTDETGSVNKELPSMILEVEFKEVDDDRTTVINRTITENSQQLEQLIKMGMAEGFTSQLERLDDLVA